MNHRSADKLVGNVWDQTTGDELFIVYYEENTSILILTDLFIKFYLQSKNI